MNIANNLLQCGASTQLYQSKMR